jgi:hypothetical protein
MLRIIGFIGALAVLLPAPALAITAKEKMETCKFGADDQKLKAAKRTAFIKRCMAEEKQDAAPKPVSAPKPSAAPKPGTPPKSSADDEGPRFPNVKE